MSLLTFMLSSMGGLFLGQPWLALIPASVLAVLFTLSRRRAAAAAAILWAVYAVYEYAMFRRWMCTGECNIRIDLLLLYPILVLASVYAAIVAIMTLTGAARAPYAER